MSLSKKNPKLIKLGKATSVLCENINIQKDSTIFDIVNSVDAELSKALTTDLSHEYDYSPTLPSSLLSCCYFWVYHKTQHHASTKIKIKDFINFTNEINTESIHLITSEIYSKEKNFRSNDISNYYFYPMKTDHLLRCLFKRYPNDIPQKTVKFLENYLSLFIPNNEKYNTTKSGAERSMRDLVSTYTDLCSRQFINYDTKNKEDYFIDIDDFRMWALKNIESEDMNIRNETLILILENGFLLLPLISSKLAELSLDTDKKRSAMDLSSLITTPAIFGTHIVSLINFYTGFSSTSWVS